jgi:hypothetical protein
MLLARAISKSKPVEFIALASIVFLFITNVVIYWHFTCKTNIQTREHEELKSAHTKILSIIKNKLYVLTLLAKQNIDQLSTIKVNNHNLEFCYVDECVNYNLLKLKKTLQEDLPKFVSYNIDINGQSLINSNNSKVIPDQITISSGPFANFKHSIKRGKILEPATSNRITKLNDNLILKTNLKLNHQYFSRELFFIKKIFTQFCLICFIDCALFYIFFKKLYFACLLKYKSDYKTRLKKI